MYLIGEKCMNPEATVNCVECGLCGRTFDNGHITNEKSCATCVHYEWGLSECDIKGKCTSEWQDDHIDKFVRKSDVCSNWKDGGKE